MLRVQREPTIVHPLLTREVHDALRAAVDAGVAATECSLDLGRELPRNVDTREVELSGRILS